MPIVIPLFPSVLYSTNITGEYTETYDKMITSYDFVRTSNTDTTYISEGYRVLDMYSDLKEKLLIEFNFFKDEVMKWYTTDFQIVSSWLTKTERNGTSLMHCHKNSFYSGVLYFDTIDGTAPIEFCNNSVDHSSWQINSPPPDEQTPINAQAWALSPGKNDLVFFPSHLYHRIRDHQSDQPRYSLAFNIIPTGVIGNSDSQVNLINIQ